MILGLGIDLVEASRIERTIERWGNRFISRVFTASEVAYCNDRASSAMAFAARFAAKEALFKALGTGWSDSIGWRDVEVIRTASGKPIIRLSGKAKEIAEKMGVGSIHLSLSHDHEHAIAVVMLE